MDEFNLGRFIFLLFVCIAGITFTACSVENDRSTPSLTPLRETTELPLPTRKPSTQTSTPVRTVVPTITMIPVASPTLDAPDLSPTMISTMRPATTEILLQVANDLLYISQGRLLRWRNDTGDIDAVVAPLGTGNESVKEQAVQYSTDARLTRFAMLRAKGITANGVELYDLSIGDIQSGQVTVLLDEIPRIHGVSLSPDGKWVAYYSQEGDGAIYVLSTEGSGPPLKVSSCIKENESECIQTSWSDDSRYFLWSDGEGVWLFDLSNHVYRLVVPNRIDVTDLDGATASIRVTFNSLRWSPMGRFVLGQASIPNSDVVWPVVIDSRLGRLADIPNSLNYQTLKASAVWASDGRLLVLRGGDAGKEPSFDVQLWRVVPTHDDLLVLDDNLDILSSDMTDLDFLIEDQGELYPGCPMEIDEGSFAFIMTEPNTGVSSDLFILDAESGELERVTELPYDSKRIIWSLDGQSAILLGQHNQVLFVPADGSGLYDLYPLLGEDLCCFSWLPAKMNLPES